MNYVRKSLTNVLAAVTGVIITSAIAFWQFYLFVTFKDSTGIIDMQGGILHLCLALTAGLIACGIGFFVFSFFLSEDKKYELHITS